MKKKVITVFGILILSIILYQILCTPYIGIANNGDFQRLMTPSGITYSEDPGLDYNGNFFKYITNSYEIVQPTDNGWFSVHQMNVMVSKLICALISKTGSYDIRYMGLSNLLFYMMGIIMLLQTFCKQENKKCFTLALILLCLGVDRYVVQYMNSFYAEIGTVTALMIAYASVLLFVNSSNKIFYKLFLFCGATVATIFAVCVKQQDILTFVPLVALLFFILRQWEVECGYSKRKCIAINIIYITILLLIVGNICTKNEGAGNITAYNVTFMDILENSDAPQEHLAKLGFEDFEQEEILEAVGTNYFSSIGQPIYDKYGDRFGRGTEIKIILSEPQILFRMFIERGQFLFRDANLGNFMESIGEAEFEKSDAFSVWSNIKKEIYVSHFGFYIAVIILATIVSIFVIKKKAIEGWILLSLSVSNVLRFFTIILGDSSHDDHKHFFALNVEFDVIYLFVAWYIIGFVLKKIRSLILILKKRQKVLVTIVLIVLCEGIFIVGNGTAKEKVSVYSSGQLENARNYILRQGEIFTQHFVFSKGKLNKVFLYFEKFDDYDEGTLNITVKDSEGEVINQYCPMLAEFQNNEPFSIVFFYDTYNLQKDEEYLIEVSIENSRGESCALKVIEPTGRNIWSNMIRFDDAESDNLVAYIEGEIVYNSYDYVLKKIEQVLFLDVIIGMLSLIYVIAKSNRI